ncbi:hypothetical protein [Shewanella xiamenensis]|uniref:hypothetical protein n=1 Tax=Shewanella xiamenensis TaxID=332186 RepID=UPI00313F235F
MKKLTFWGKLCSAALLIVGLNSVVAATESSTLTFRGEVAEPSCYSDLSSISCYNQSTHQFDTQAISFNFSEITSLDGIAKNIPTNFSQINSLAFNRLDRNEVMISFNYN